MRRQPYGVGVGHLATLWGIAPGIRAFRVRRGPAPLRSGTGTGSGPASGTCTSASATGVQPGHHRAAGTVTIRPGTWPGPGPAWPPHRAFRHRLGRHRHRPPAWAGHIWPGRPRRRATGLASGTGTPPLLHSLVCQASPPHRATPGRVYNNFIQDFPFASGRCLLFRHTAPLAAPAAGRGQRFNGYIMLLIILPVNNNNNFSFPPFAGHRPLSTFRHLIPGRSGQIIPAPPSTGPFRHRSTPPLSSAPTLYYSALPLRIHFHHQYYVPVTQHYNAFHRPIARNSTAGFRH